MRQQIDEAHRLGPLARREGDRPTAAGIDAQIREFGQYARDRIVESDLALFDKLHERDRGHRLGHAGDAE